MIEAQPADAIEPPAGSMNVTEFTGLLALITSMLAAMEGRIIGRLNENADLAKERWERHDADSKRTLADWDLRFGTLETRVNGHLEEERNEDLVLRARIKPVQTLAGWLARNWRGIAIAVMAILGILGLTEGRLP